MTFQPVVPITGLAGWQFLQRTYDKQFDAFTGSVQVQRDADYFREKIGSITSAEELVKDRRLLGIALGAFGLEGDIENRYFIRKILEDGTADDDALANRLADDRYKDLSLALGLGPGQIPLTGNATMMESLLAKSQTQAFEVAVGEQDNSMRIALFAQRALADLATESGEERTKWFTMMGQPPLRQFFETALGLPRGFGQIDIDQQMEVFRERTGSLTGNNAMSQFTDPDNLEKMTRIYLARAQIAGFGAGQSSNANALTLLQAARR